MIYSFALILILIAQLIFSCSIDNNTKEIKLDSEKWFLQKITQGKISENIIDKPANYSLKFDKTNFKMLSDCNKCSGKYTTASKFIKFEEINCSKKMCGKDSFDYLFRKNIEIASSFKIVDQVLILQSYKGKMYFSAK